MNRVEERKRATELKAVDAREMIRASLSSVLPQLTAANLDQLQRVLDVAAINADIENRAGVLDQKSIKGKIIHSDRYLRDPSVVAQRDKVLAQKITLKPGNNAVQLDFHKLITPEALKPTSDNPDEAAYLFVVADIFLYFGVWLVLDSSAAYWIQQLGATDPRKWRVRLLLGYTPRGLEEEITSTMGRLDRRALLSVKRIGAGYYEWVHAGPTLKSLGRALELVRSNITKGRDEHLWWSAHRGEFPVVSKISDTVGRADWPNEGIWDQPHKIHVQALNLINEGKLREAAKFALLAAYQARWCAGAVSDYINATLRGASRVKSLLEVVAAIADVAETILSIWFVGEGIFRLLTRKGATLALEGSAQRQLGEGRAMRQLPAPANPTPPIRAQTIADNSMPAKGLAGNPKVLRFNTNLGDAIGNVRRELGLPPLPARTVSQLHYAARGARADIEVMEWIEANPNATWPEKLEKMDQIYERWRVRGMPGEE